MIAQFKGCESIRVLISCILSFPQLQQLLMQQLLTLAVSTTV
jgi:hypothetical protein